MPDRKRSGAAGPSRSGNEGAEGSGDEEEVALDDPEWAAAAGAKPTRFVFGSSPSSKRASPGGSPLTRRPAIKPAKSLAQARVRVGFSNQDPTFRTSGNGHLVCNCCDGDIIISKALSDVERDQALQRHMCHMPWTELKWKTYMCHPCQQAASEVFLDLFQPEDEADVPMACVNCTKTGPGVGITAHEINIASRESRAKRRVLPLCENCTESCAAQLASLRK